MILICGLPDAGKTTYAKAHYSNVIHFDEVRGRTRREKIVEAVRADNSLVIEGVYTKAKERKKLVEASMTRNTCIWLDTPLSVCIDREVNGRKRSARIVQWAFEDWQEPTFDEGWDEIIIIRGEDVERSCRQT